jgi:hypothetical protein
MLPLDKLMEDSWEVRKFHGWYMATAKARLCSFIRIPSQMFISGDDNIVIDFKDMHRLMRNKELDILSHLDFPNHSLRLMRDKELLM